MARVDVVREARLGSVGDWQPCLHWARYRYDDGSVEYGYRFVWRRDDGSIQGARGQARIPSLADARDLMEAAGNDGWGDRNGDQMAVAAERLEEAGCVVDLASGYVGWPSEQAAREGKLNEQIIADERLIREWSH